MALEVWQQFRARLSSFRGKQEFRKLLREIRGTIDQEEFAEIRARHYYADHDPMGPLKYFDIDKYLARDLARAIHLGLHAAPPSQVLDLGCGFGYFMFVCTHFGHSCLGLDFVDGNQPDVACYADMLELLGQTRVLHRIEPNQPLPDFSNKYDLVTAFQMCFNWRPEQPDVRWDIAEWDYFLRDVKTRLTPRGRLLLEFNPPLSGGPCFTPAQKEFFLRYGGQPERKDEVILFPSPDGLPA